jgi:pyruvate/2-oxoglutarate dehydrogenase complex dihydrolipoamide dehydrogenase (E3) component
MASEYDVIVIGAGPTGENVADRAVRGGLTAAIVEAELVGGECSYWACMPSKALLRPADVVAEAGAVRGVAGARLNPAEVLARRDSFAHGWKDDDQVEWLTGAKIDLFRGHGRIAGERLVTVGDTSLRARQAVVIATGTRAVVLDSLAGVNPWTSREATSAHAVPGRLAIVGGGVVGCEMAAAWSALCSEVTLISHGRLLDRLPEFAGDFVAAGLRDAGVDVRIGVDATGATRAGGTRGTNDAGAGAGDGGAGGAGEAGAGDGGAGGAGDASAGDASAGDAGVASAGVAGAVAGGGAVTLTLSDGSSIEADEVLSAVGRSPHTGDIGLETVGLTPGSWLDVDDTMRVTAVHGGWLYAAGDVNHLALLTHMGKYQARVCGDAIAARAGDREPTVRDVSSKTCVPQVIFTIPEVAAVGLTAEQAEAAGRRVRTVEYEIGNVAGAKLFADEYQGHAQMVVDEDRRTIVGMTLAGHGVGETIHAATIAVAGEVPLERLWHAVPSYPTISEIWLRLLETYGL